MSDPSVPDTDSGERADVWGDGFVEEREPEPQPTREMLRSRRKHAVRARTILNPARGGKRTMELGRLMYPPEDDEPRPKTREECAEVERPCPFVSCQYNLYLEVSPKTGSIKQTFPDLEPDEMPERRSCVLDIAEDGGMTLEDVGAALNVTRERIRQIEVKAYAKVIARSPAGLLDHVPGPSRVHLRVVDGGVDGTFDVGGEAAFDRVDGSFDR